MERLSPLDLSKIVSTQSMSSTTSLESPQILLTYSFSQSTSSSIKLRGASETALESTPLSEAEAVLSEVLDPKNLDPEMNSKLLEEKIKNYTTKLETVIDWLKNNKNSNAASLNILLREYSQFNLAQGITGQLSPLTLQSFQTQNTQLKALIHLKIPKDAHLDELDILKKSAESDWKTVADRVLSYAIHNGLKKTANSLSSRMIAQNPGSNLLSIMEMSYVALENIVKILEKQNKQDNQIKNEIKKLSSLLSRFDTDFYNFLMAHQSESSKKIVQSLGNINKIVSSVYQLDGQASPRLTPRRGNSVESPRLTSPRVYPNVTTCPTWF